MDAESSQGTGFLLEGPSARSSTSPSSQQISGKAAGHVSALSRKLGIQLQPFVLVNPGVNQPEECRFCDNPILIDEPRDGFMCAEFAFARGVELR